MTKKIVTIFWDSSLGLDNIIICLFDFTFCDPKQQRNELNICFWGCYPSMATYRYLTIINGLLLILEICSTVIPLKNIAIFRAYLRPHLIILMVVFSLLVMYYFFNFYALLCDMYSIWFSWSFLTAF
jgi:hypothetical protein